MHYHLTIVRTEANPHFEEELKKYQEDRRYRSYPMDESGPQHDLAKNVLTCHLTEEQFKAVKAAALNVFE